MTITESLDKIDGAESLCLKFFCEASIDIFSMACYCREKEAASMVAEVLDSLKKVVWIATSCDGSARYKLCTAITHLFVSDYTDNKRAQLEAAYYDSMSAQSLAWLSGKVYLKTQAEILGDYIYFKANGIYRPGRTQKYGNVYCPPREYCRTLKHHRLKTFDWSQVDVEVREWILKERDFYRDLIYEIQPEFVRKEMDAEPDQLKKELLL